MQNLLLKATCLAFALVLVAALCAGPAAAADGIYKEGGLIKVRPPEVDPKLQNDAWPKDLEEGFWKRANHAIGCYAGAGGGATTGEHEKWGYPKSLFAILAGNRDPAVGYLSAKDGEQMQTLGVDFYWCFCLKNQPRKYFQYGKEWGIIPETHLELMRKAAAIWTKEDPRPTMELVLALESDDADVRAYALKLLKQMKARDLGKVAAACTNEDAKEAVLAFKATPLAKEDFGDDLQRWRTWWKFFADRDWKVFEEYERVINPNPHPKFGVGTGPVGGSWDPKTRGGWVDARNTDNLRSMREVAVYLFAEEVGNETIRKLYKEKLKRFVVGLYHVGMGEWDSETYHGHSIAPWLGCYDFAKDPEVKLMAKAALDWLTMAGALKYYRGGYGGPTKRDYGGGNKVFGAGLSHMMYLYFGDSPMEDPEPHYDDVHAIASAYRPPRAVAALARKDFPRPVEQLDTKPTYSHWLPGASEHPEFWETIHFGKTYYLGTVVSRGGAGDVGPFKMLAYNGKRGVDFVVMWTGKRYNTKRAGDQIGQYGNLCIHLRKDADSYSAMIPKSATVETEGGITFGKLEKTWIALRPVNLGELKVQGLKGKDAGTYKESQMLTAAASGNGLAGLAMEVGESPTSYAAFKAAVKSKGKLDLSKLAQNEVELTGSDGRELLVTYNTENDLPTVCRDCKPRVWYHEQDLYKSVGQDGPVNLGWKEGTLTVKAGGHTFTQTVTEDGKVTFSEK